MKPWLLELLACPIDKHYPLELHVFGIENDSDTSERVGRKTLMSEDLRFFFTVPGQEEEESEKVTVINQEIVNDGLEVYDTLVRAPAPVDVYARQILDCIGELEPITVHGIPWLSEAISRCKALGEKLQMILHDLAGAQITRQEELLEEIKEELLLLNWVKQAIEIEEGVMRCSRCNRWFPIKETIPQMLPDELRKKDEDVEFLNRWKALLDGNILYRGIPFSLDGDSIDG